MTLQGIHLTDRGDPIGDGALRLFKGDQSIDLPAHDLICVSANLYDQPDALCLKSRIRPMDPARGLYPYKDDASGLSVQLPLIIARFIHAYLRHPPGRAEETVSYTHQKTTQKQNSHLAGHASLQTTDGSTIDLDITSLTVTGKPFAEGLGFVVRADLISKLSNNTSAKQAKKRAEQAGALYRLETEFLIPADTVNFRYQHAIQKIDRRPGLRRAYAGDEVQTNLFTMNLNHPLIYNTGGIYGLSKDGVHSVDISQQGTYIRPVQLQGWGWGTVYEGDTNIRTQSLYLPWLTKDLLTHSMRSMSRAEGRKFTASITRHDSPKGTLGDFIEDYTGTPDRDDDRNAVNARTIEAVSLDFSIDKFGLAIALDAKLSAITPATLDRSIPPQQKNTYRKVILLPWEVLIFRDIDMSYFLTKSDDWAVDTPDSPRPSSTFSSLLSRLISWPR